MKDLQAIREGNWKHISSLSSVVQQGAADRVSDKYSFIPTTRIIDTLAENGWEIRDAKEARNRTASTVGFGKHLIRFQNPDMPKVAEKDTTYPEIVLTTSHDGFSSFKLMGGLFRVVCGNGLVIADAMFASMNIRHIGYTDDAVRDAIGHVLTQLPQVANAVKDWQNISLSYDERIVFAHAAVAFKFEHEPERVAKIDLGKVVRPMRGQDSDNSLWNTFNAVQEKLTKGDRLERDGNQRSWGVQHYKKVRGVNGISESIRLNKALWTLADGMAKIKKGEKVAIDLPLA